MVSLQRKSEYCYVVMLIFHNVFPKNAVSNKNKCFVEVAAQCLCNNFSIVLIISYVEGKLVTDVHT